MARGKFTISFKGLDEYALKLSNLGDKTEEVAGTAIYEGAKIVADAVKANIQQLPTVDFRARGTSENKLDGVTELQKKGLDESFGISTMQNSDGYFNVKLGFDGYNAVKTQAHPGGQPNQLIARSIEGGTSFRQPHPFVAPALRKTRKAALQKMREVIDEEINKIMK